METKMEEVEWVQERFDQLNLIDEKIMIALYHGQLHHKSLKKGSDKKVHPREFKKDNLVLKKILPIHKDSPGSGPQTMKAHML